MSDLSSSRMVSVESGHNRGDLKNASTARLQFSHGLGRFSEELAHVDWPYFSVETLGVRRPVGCCCRLGWM
jgi:hypothetical protein